MESDVVVDEQKPIEVKPKMHFTGKVVKTSLAGAVIDIGAAQPAVIHISQIATPDPQATLHRVEDVLQIGQEIEVWVRRVREDHIELTMFKPLDLEWREIKKGMSVKGKVTRLEKFGAFVEIGAERPGLVHISEMAHGYVRQPSDVVKEGDEIEAEVLDVNRRKKQIKLSMKALLPEPVKEEPKKEEPKREEHHKEEHRPAPTPVSAQSPRERPANRRRKSRRPHRGGDEPGELLLNIDEAGQNESEPTVLGMALMEAMERAKVRRQQSQKARKSSRGVSQEQEALLTRTLQEKERSS